MQEKSVSDSGETAESWNNVNKHRSILFLFFPYVNTKYCDSILMQSISTIEYYRIKAFFTYD